MWPLPCGPAFPHALRLQRAGDPVPDRPVGRAQGGQARGPRGQKLVGREIALIFEKDSTRTRCAFEVAAYDQGAHVTFIGPSGSHMGHKESVKDTARVLGRMPHV
jgi:ornithine carbamoyltransferase